MADYLSRACRLQLTTAMENLIRTAVFEISQIFEDNLHDHQMELARKGEEIAYLKVKLQRAELRLKEVSPGSGTDATLNLSYEIPRTSEEPAPHQSPIVSEPDFEGPDDWCVPLGSEMVKQENPCPSVRLRQFSIPLFPIPLKHEAFRKLEVPRLRPRHNKDTAQKKGLQQETKHKRKPGRPRRSENNVKNVLMNIKEESLDNNVEPLKRRVGRPKSKIHKFKNTNVPETQTDPSGKTFCCRFCPKVFDTKFGLSVHDRAHKKCRGCKKIFPFPSVLKQHKPRCKYYKKLMKLYSVSPQKTEEVSKEISSIEQKDKSSVQLKSPLRKNKMFTCKCCRTKFDSRSGLMRHPCFLICQVCNKRLSNRTALAVHMGKMHKGVTGVGQKKIDACFLTCQMCNKRLSSRMALAVHMGKMHKGVKGVGEKKMDASWTKPLEETEDSQKRTLSPSERKGLIKRCSEGFQCSLCKHVYLSKYSAIDHTFVHTGEKPFKCAFCSQAFQARNALTVHRKKYHGFVLKKFIKCACSKTFYRKSNYKEHKLSCPVAGK